MVAGARALLEPLAPSDEVRPGDPAHVGWTLQPDERRELADVVAVGPPRLVVADIGEPFELGRHRGEAVELGRGEMAVFECDGGFQEGFSVGVLYA